MGSKEARLAAHERNMTPPAREHFLVEGFGREGPREKHVPDEQIRG